MLPSKCFVIFTCSFLFFTTLSAQSIWLNHDRGNSLAVEILKLSSEGGGSFVAPNEAIFIDYRFLSAAMFLSGRFSLGNNMILIGELSAVYVTWDVISLNFNTGQTGAPKNGDQATIGNPYLGVELGKPNSATFTEIGIRLPLTPANKPVAASFGGNSDFDRFEAFTPDILTLTGKINYRHQNAAQVVTRLRGGPTVFLTTGGNDGDTEWFFDYSAQVGYEGEKLNIMGGLTGRMLVSEEGLDLSERTFHQFTLAASLNRGQLRPGVMLRFPLDDDLRRANNYVFGLTLGIQLNETSKTNH